METYINKLLQNATNTKDSELEAILTRADKLEGLSHQEVAALLATTNQDYIKRIFEIAGRIKKRIYGDRIVLFAPLYISDYCVNNCTYCGFKADKHQKRRKLTQAEVKAETAALERMGHKRLALEAGEDPKNCPLDYVLECIDTIYTTSDIRRVNVNIAALDVPDFKRLNNADIGTYVLFQETYHRPTYEKVHKGPKADYDFHLRAFERAMEAGIDDVGAGVLFGLYDYKYEVLALMLHNEELEKQFGVGFHTISVPRLRSVPQLRDANSGISDDDFLKLVAVLRMAVPFTGMIVSTRESPDMRRKLINMGISQMSAGSRTTVGGYNEISLGTAGPQFSLADHRGAGEIFYWLMEEDILPSFCTACYRSNRKGDRFMKLAKSGEIKNVCIPNSLLTLKEYALDYGDDRFKRLADTLIDQRLRAMDNKKTEELLKLKLSDLINGERDIYI